MPTDPTASFDDADARPPKRRGRAKRWILTVLILLGIVVILAGIKFAQIKMMIDAGKAAVPPPESVSAATVQETEWASTTPAVATLVPFRGVTLSAEVSGTVREIDFENGALVKKGSVLVRLDSSTEEAQLRSARAELSLAKISFERANRLYKAQVNAQSELDSARVKQEQAEASVANLEAVIAKKVIRAPFDGRLGIRAVELGQVVNPGSPIVSLNTVTPIYAEFLLPQQALGELKEGQQVELTVDVFPKEKWEGKLTLLNHEVDPQTRNVRIRATVDNPDGRLAPGMFGRVQVIASQAQKVLIIPQTSVVFAPYGDSVFVIEKDKKGGEKAPLVANQRFIRLGENKGDFVVVTAGLQSGETVVKDGAFKLRNGQTVAVNDANGSTPKLSPEPKEE